MADPTLKLNLGGNEFILPPTARRIKLYKRIGVNVPATLELETIDYIVPAGKKLWILRIEVNGQTGDSMTEVRKHTVIDINAGTLISQINTPTTGKNTLDEFISVEAGKYINATQVNAANPQDIWAHCVELNV